MPAGFTKGKKRRRTIVKFWLNGQPKEFSGDPDQPLLTYLRDVEGIISPKDGCAPQAACGCCAVDLNGKAVLSCVTPMKKAADGRVTTIEGLGEYRQNVYANAFVEKGGVQCGFCIPGIVIQSNALINKNPEPSRDEIAQALTPHLCRCTGYKKIVDAVEYAAEALRNEEEIAPPNGAGRIGSRYPKYQAQQLVLGQHQYVDDVKLEGMLHGALKFSDHPRAVVKRIDVSAAAAMEGVVRVFTAADVPGGRFIGLIKQDWPLMVAEGETTRYVGDVLAGVVAVSEAAARQAVASIVVEYEVLTPLTDMHAALQPDAPAIHSQGNVLSRTVTQPRRPGGGARGLGLRGAGRLPDADDRARLHGDGSGRGLPGRGRRRGSLAGPGRLRRPHQIAKLLGLPEAQVRVIMVPNGGGFGGKEDLTVQGHAALAAHLCCSSRSRCASRAMSRSACTPSAIPSGWITAWAATPTAC
jgi:aldehyde oxidoreductase